MFKNILTVAVALSLPLVGRANDLHLHIPESTQAVLAPKASALTLKEVEARLINDQLELQQSYERLIQAQKRISLARANYFPYGLHTVAGMYFLNIWSPLLLVELFTSLPSKIYFVQSEKNMYMAQKYGHVALKENLKNQVAGLYFDILKEESALKLAKMELTLLETLYKVVEEKVRLGLVSAEDLRKLEVRILDTRDVCLKFTGYLNEEKTAFNMMISEMPEEAKKIELQTVGSFLDSEEYKLSSEILKLNALDRAPELVSADYMITAAIKNKKSLAWSILSFSGIGFPYFGRLQVAGSKVDEARAQRELTQDNLSKQAYIANNSFHRMLDSFNSERMVFEGTAFHYAGEFARFQAGEIALDRLIETEIAYLRDFKDVVVSHYDSLKKLSDLERVALNEVKGNDAELEQIDIRFDDIKNGKYSLSVKAEQKIKSVEYVFDRAGLENMTITNPHTDFGVILGLVDAKDFKGHINVNYENGTTVTKLFKF